MTASTRRISERNLHERLALTGPPDEITELADTVDGLLARLERAFDAQRRFVANASHELRTPLAMMRTSVDVAVSKPAPVGKEVTVLAGKLREGLDAADRLLEGLLLLARAQTNGHGEIEVVSLAELATSALQMRADTIAAKNLSVENRTSTAIAHGNPTLLASLVDKTAARNWIEVASICSAGRSSAWAPSGRHGPAPGWGCRSSRRSPRRTAEHCHCTPETKADCARRWNCEDSCRGRRPAPRRRYRGRPAGPGHGGGHRL